MFLNVEEYINNVTVPSTNNVRVLGCDDVLGPALTITVLPTSLVLLAIRMNLHDVATATAFPSTLKSCSILVVQYNVDDRHMLLPLIKLLPAQLETFKLLLYSPSKYWDLQMVSHLPRSLKVLVTSKFSNDVEMLEQLPPTLTEFDVERCYTNEFFNDSNYQHMPIGITTLNVKISRDLPQIELATLSRFTSLRVLEMTIMEDMEDNVFGDGFSGLPSSLKSLTICMCVPDKHMDVDQISKITFPPFLESLNIVGNNTMLDMAQWQPLPDSIKIITLNSSIIRTLPSRWPSMLAVLTARTHRSNPSIDPTLESRMRLPVTDDSYPFPRIPLHATCFVGL